MMTSHIDSDPTLSLLQGSGSIAQYAPTEGLEQCPYCQQVFRGPSLAIHIRRCRSIPKDTENEFNQTKINKRTIPSLLDMCLKVVSNNYNIMYLYTTSYDNDPRRVQFIDALPSHLLDRLIMQLLKENKELRKQRDAYQGEKRQMEMKFDASLMEIRALKQSQSRLQTLKTIAIDRKNQIRQLQMEIKKAANDKYNALQQSRKVEKELKVIQQQKNRLETKLKGQSLPAKSMDCTCSKYKDRKLKPSKACPSTQGIRSTSNTCKASSVDSTFIKIRPRSQNSKIPWPKGLREI